MNVSNYVRTAEAAEILGVSPGTVRNWADSGKLPARRLPQNRYRLFLKKDLEAVLREVEGADAARGAREGRKARKRA